MNREYLRLTCVAIIAVSLAGCSYQHLGRTYAIGAECSSMQWGWFETRRECEAFVAHQIKIGNALNGDCNFTQFRGRWDRME